MDDTICCIKECDLPVLALGLCNKHWRRNKKFGSPVALSRHSGSNRGLSAEDRFWMGVVKSEGCWIWKLSKDKNGYGIFRGAVGDEMFTKAHRFSYALHTGDLLIGMQALHTCDNPSCVNPDHLFSGTNADNMRDKVQKGRSRVPVGEQNGHAVLTRQQVRCILKDPRPYTEIATQYNVAPSTIGSIKQRVSWQHIDEEVVTSVRIGQRGEDCYAAKITEEDVLAIRASNESGRQLAAMYGVSPQSITDIRKRRSWKHI